MDEKIKKFLEKWNEMLDAATDIEDFKYEIKIAVTSDKSLIADREQLIAGVNESFTKHNMSYKSTSQS